MRLTVDSCSSHSFAQGSFHTTGSLAPQFKTVCLHTCTLMHAAAGAIAWGLASILLVTPLLGLLVARLPLQPPGLSLGLAVFCCMPTALSSGVTFTQQLGANVSLALLLTVSSNILGIFTLPFSLPHVLAAAAPGLSSVALPAAAQAGSVSPGGLEPLQLLLQLCKTILLPTVVGAAIRGFVPGEGARGSFDYQWWCLHTRAYSP